MRDPIDRALALASWSVFAIAVGIAGAVALLAWMGEL